MFSYNQNNRSNVSSNGFIVDFIQPKGDYKVNLNEELRFIEENYLLFQRNVLPRENFKKVMKEIKLIKEEDEMKNPEYEEKIKTD